MEVNTTLIDSAEFDLIPDLAPQGELVASMHKLYDQFRIGKLSLNDFLARDQPENSSPRATLSLSLEAERYSPRTQQNESYSPEAIASVLSTVDSIKNPDGTPNERVQNLVAAQVTAMVELTVNRAQGAEDFPDIPESWLVPYTQFAAHTYTDFLVEDGEFSGVFSPSFRNFFGQESQFYMVADPQITSSHTTLTGEPAEIVRSETLIRNKDNEQAQEGSKYTDSEVFLQEVHSATQALLSYFLMNADAEFLQKMGEENPEEVIAFYDWVFTNVAASIQADFISLSPAQYGSVRVGAMDKLSQNMSMYWMDEMNTAGRLTHRGFWFDAAKRNTPYVSERGNVHSSFERMDKMLLAWQEQNPPATATPEPTATLQPTTQPTRQYTPTPYPLPTKKPEAIALPATPIPPIDPELARHFPEASLPDWFVALLSKNKALLGVIGGTGVGMGGFLFRRRSQKRDMAMVESLKAVIGDTTKDNNRQPVMWMKVEGRGKHAYHAPDDLKQSMESLYEDAPKHLRRYFRGKSRNNYTEDLDVVIHLPPRIRKFLAEKYGYTFSAY